MMRHTKIVATLGPSSSDPLVLERMLLAGVDVVRLNFSHGRPEDHLARAQAVREAALKVGRPVGILADLQGPKIRVGKFARGRIERAPGAPFILDANCDIGDETRVGHGLDRLRMEIGDHARADDAESDVRFFHLGTPFSGRTVRSGRICAAKSAA